MHPYHQIDISLTKIHKDLDAITRVRPFKGAFKSRLKPVLSVLNHPGYIKQPARSSDNTLNFVPRYIKVFKVASILKKETTGAILYSKMYRYSVEEPPYVVI